MSNEELTNIREAFDMIVCGFSFTKTETLITGISIRAQYYTNSTYPFTYSHSSI